MKRRFFILVTLPLLGCSFTNDVNRRKPGHEWYYYGGLLDYYRDQAGGSTVSRVWLEEVQTLEVKKSDFGQSVRTYLKQGYRPIGQIAVQSVEPIYPETIKRIAAQKGAQVVVSYSVTQSTVSGERPEVVAVDQNKLGQPNYAYRFAGAPWTKKNYFFQFLGK